MNSRYHALSKKQQLFYYISDLFMARHKPYIAQKRTNLNLIKSQHRKKYNIQLNSVNNDLNSG